MPERPRSGRARVGVTGHNHFSTLLTGLQPWRSMASIAGRGRTKVMLIPLPQSQIATLCTIWLRLGIKLNQ